MRSVTRKSMSSDFWLLWTGQTVSFLGTNVTLIAMPWMVLSITHSAAQTSLTYALEFLPYLLFSIPAGSLADRVNRQRLMILANLLAAVALASIPLAAMLRHLTVAHILSVVLVVNTSAVLYNAAGTACVPNLVAKDALYRANSWLQMGTSVGGTFGTPIGGLLVALFPAPDVILLDALSYLVSALLLGFISTPFQSQSSGNRSWQGMWDGIRFIMHFPLFRTNAVILTWTNLAANAVFAVLVYHMKDELHLSGVQSGTVLGAWGVGMFIGSTLTSRLESKLTTGSLFRMSRVLAALPPLLYAWCNGWIWLCVASAFTGMSMVMYTIQSTSLRQQYTPDELRGRVGIAHTMMARFGIPIGAAIGGFAAARAGAHPVFLCAGVLQCVMLAVVWLSPMSRLGVRGQLDNPRTSGVAS